MAEKLKRAIIWLLQVLALAASWVGLSTYGDRMFGENHLAQFAALYFLLLMPLYLFLFTVMHPKWLKEKASGVSYVPPNNLVEVRPILERVVVWIIFPCMVWAGLLWIIHKAQINSEWPLMGLIALTLLPCVFAMMIISGLSGWLWDEAVNESYQKRGVPIPQAQLLSAACLWALRGTACFLYTPLWMLMHSQTFQAEWINAQPKPVALPYLPVAQLGGSAFWLSLGLFCWLMMFWSTRGRPTTVWQSEARIDAPRFTHHLNLKGNYVPSEAERNQGRKTMKIGFALIGLGVFMLIFWQVLNFWGVS